jgi:hypothetical protein
MFAQAPTRCAAKRGAGRRLGREQVRRHPRAPRPRWYLLGGRRAGSRSAPMGVPLPSPALIPRCPPLMSPRARASTMMRRATATAWSEDECLVGARRRGACHGHDPLELTHGRDRRRRRADRYPRLAVPRVLSVGRNGQACTYSRYSWRCSRWNKEVTAHLRHRRGAAEVPRSGVRSGDFPGNAPIRRRSICSSRRRSERSLEILRASSPDRGPFA